MLKMDYKYTRIINRLNRNKYFGSCILFNQENNSFYEHITLNINLNKTLIVPNHCDLHIDMMLREE